MLSGSEIHNKVIDMEDLSLEEVVFLFQETELEELMYLAHDIRKKKKGNEAEVTWLIDRNVNITNVCCSQCKFCNFYVKPGNEKAYITSLDQYKAKIDELKRLGGNQLLLQGGLHPKLGLSFYKDLFKDLKQIDPELKLHALGPPEIIHISRLEKTNISEVLQELVKAGLDSLPGAGAEILSDRVRKLISPVKCNTQEWLDVMHEAHKLNLITSATMMFGHVETLEEIANHLILLRNTQSKKPKDSVGFISFTPWPFMDQDTVLKKELGKTELVTSEFYIRLIAISRIVLHNVDNIQASWLTVGKDVAQMCLHAGANDFGSIMIEENVVSSAGASHKFDVEGIQEAISEAGFVPKQRNQEYKFV